MSAVDLLRRTPGLLEFLRTELADYPGRMSWTLRLWGVALLLVVISMTLDVPFLVLSLGAVAFGAVQPNVVLTRLLCIGLVVATVFVVATQLLVLKATYGYPMLRITVSSLIFLGGMYLMRVHKLGIVFFTVAIAIMIGQTTPDTLDFPEIGVRMSLWTGVALVYPVLVIWLLYVWFFPQKPLPQLRSELHRQLAGVASRLQQVAEGDVVDEARSQASLDRDASNLQRLHALTSADDAGYRQVADRWKRRIDAVGYLRAVVCGLPLVGAADADTASLLSRMREQILALDASFAGPTPFRCTWCMTPGEVAAAERMGLVGACRVLDALGHVDSLPSSAAATVRGGMFVPDAFTNPVYLRFALKALLASLICYVFYHGVDWDGIHTSMITCGLVANPTLAATSRKLVLRFGGAMIGSLLALLFSLALLPHIDGIVGLLLMAAPVFFVGAWIATGSERSGYIGVQLVATFCIAVMADFGPHIDLTEIRDRAMGIWIGTAVSAVVYAFVWPESEQGSLREKLGDLRRQLAALVSRPMRCQPDDDFAYLQQWSTCRAALEACEDMCERVSVERAPADAKRQVLLADGNGTVRQGRRLLRSWDALRGQLARAPDDALATCVAWQARLGAWIAPAAAQGTSVGPLSGVPSLAPAVQRVLDDIAAMPPWATSTPGASVEPATEVAP